MLRISIQAIWYFEPLSASSRVGLKLFRRLGLGSAEIRQVHCHIGQVRNNAGESELIKLTGDALAICSRIKREHLVDNPAIQALQRDWAPNKVVFFFEKLAEQEVRTEVLRIGLVGWMARTLLKAEPASCVLLIERNQWFLYLESYSRSRGINLIGYRGFYDLWGAFAGGLRITRGFGRMLGTRAKTFPALLRRPSSQNRAQKFQSTRPQPTGSIAIRYWGRKLSLDPTERSEFFWLDPSEMPETQVVLYDFESSKPLDVGLEHQLRQHGIRLLGRGPGIAAWRPTRRRITVLVRTAFKIFRAVLSCLARGQRIPLYFVRQLLTLALDYARWYDFFSSHRVRVNVGTMNTTVGQILALDALNGVSMSYQYSASNIAFATTLLSSGENVQFVFSPAFDNLWRCIEAPVDHTVQTGYIYDGAIRTVRQLDRTSAIRKQLESKGARFVLCFFDENSRDRWDIYASNREAAADYKFLFEWLLSEPSLGLVLKPKKSTDLFQRITEVSTLINRAKETGRCCFLTSETVVGSTYPAEAALLADVCIGKLSGSTSALEARLAGIPTLLVDVEGFYTHPFYRWGRGRVVFSDWESLRAAVEQYRLSPQAHPEFGDWSPGLNDLDPFRDGQASVRMGNYIRTIYQALEQGKSKQTAMATAAEQFAQKWGDRSIARRELPHKKTCADRQA